MYLPNQPPGAPFPPPTSPVERLADAVVLQYGTVAYFKDDPASTRCDWCLSMGLGSLSIAEIMQMMPFGRPPNQADRVRRTTAGLLFKEGFVAFESRWEGHVSVMFGESPVTPWDKAIQNGFNRCFETRAAEEVSND